MAPSWLLQKNPIREQTRDRVLLVKEKDVFSCCAIESVYEVVDSLYWFWATFGFCGWIPVCIPSAAFQLKCAGRKDLLGYFFAFGAPSIFCSHGNEFFGNVSLGAFKFVNRHVHPPVMVIKPDIWYRSLNFKVLNFWQNNIHFNLFVKKNQVASSFPTEILLDRIADGNIKITNIFR